VSEVQEVKQLVPPALHTNGGHDTDPLASQLPAPSHVIAFVWTPPTQVCAAQMVPEAHRWHAPAPSHTPLVPQVLSVC